MKNKLLFVCALASMMMLGFGAKIVTATEFDDPNVRAMHSMVNNLPTKAESGDPQAQTGMGMISLYAFGGKQDFATARQWFQKAADQGYPEAMVQLGNIYENGLGQNTDPVKALNLYKQASELNYPQGRFRLGMLFLNGIGTEKNVDQGMKLLRSACDNGYRTSCGWLLWQENKLTDARSEFNIQCQAGDRVACDFMAQLGPGSGNEDGGKAESGQGGRIWIYLVIGLIFVGVLIFWLIRNDSEEEERKVE